MSKYPEILLPRIETEYPITRFLRLRVIEDPALSEADRVAKRAIIDSAKFAIYTSDKVPEGEPDQVGNNGRQHGIAQAYEAVLNLMAEVYASHPDYDEEWRP